MEKILINLYSNFENKRVMYLSLLLITSFVIPSALGAPFWSSRCDETCLRQRKAHGAPPPRAISKDVDNLMAYSRKDIVQQVEQFEDLWNEFKEMVRRKY